MATTPRSSAAVPGEPADDGAHRERQDLSDLARLPELQDLVAQAAEHLSAPGAPVWCGVSLAAGNGLIETIAASSDLPIRFDWLQCELGQGPRVGPTRHVDRVVSADVAGDERWPDFGPLCASVIGVRSVLSMTMPLHEDSHVVLTFGSELAAVFGEEKVAEARQLARDMAARTLGVAGSWEPEEDSPYLDSRLARALGILMARYRLQPSDAFFMLHKASRDLGCGLLELAIEVVLTGRLPARQINDARHTRRPSDNPELAGLRPGGRAVLRSIRRRSCRGSRCLGWTWPS